MSEKMEKKLKNTLICVLVQDVKKTEGMLFGAGTNLLIPLEQLLEQLHKMP